MSVDTAGLMLTAAPGGDIQATNYLSPNEMQAARQIAQWLNVLDTMALTSFVVKAQKDMASLPDPVIKMVATNQLILKHTGMLQQGIAAVARETVPCRGGSLLGCCGAIPDAGSVLGADLHDRCDAIHTGSLRGFFAGNRGGSRPRRAEA